MYYLLIRKKAIPKITVLTIFVIGLVVSSSILPLEQQGILSLVKKVVVPIIELVVLVVVIYKSRIVIRNYKKQKNEKLDFYDAVKIALKEVVPRNSSNLLWLF